MEDVNGAGVTFYVRRGIYRAAAGSGQEGTDHSPDRWKRVGT